MAREYKILLGIGLGAIVIGYLLFKFAGAPAAPSALTLRADAYSLGATDAPITITEFADFQCPACRMAKGVTSQLLAAYPGQVRIVFRHFPLNGHPLAQPAAQAAEAAGAQGKFWEMHDALYENQDDWGDATKPLSRKEAGDRFMSYARDLGLDEAKFKADYENNSFSQNISGDQSAGNLAGVNSTPQFFVNETMIENPSYAAISAEVDKRLGK